jgi:hypothetical protein
LVKAAGKLAVGRKRALKGAERHHLRAMSALPVSASRVLTHCTSASQSGKLQKDSISRIGSRDFVVMLGLFRRVVTRLEVQERGNERMFHIHVAVSFVVSAPNLAHFKYKGQMMMQQRTEDLAKETSIQGLV